MAEPFKKSHRIVLEVVENGVKGEVGVTINAPFQIGVDAMFNIAHTIAESENGKEGKEVKFKSFRYETYYRS